MNEPIWKFTHFTSKRYLFHQKWERTNEDLLEEIMLISECIDPLTGNKRMEKSTHYGSRNAWYHYKKFYDYQNEGSYRIEVWSTGENMELPYGKPHYVFIMHYHGKINL